MFYSIWHCPDTHTHGQWTHLNKEGVGQLMNWVNVLWLVVEQEGRGIPSERKIQDVAGVKMEAATWEGMWVASPSWEQVLADLEQENGNASLTTTRSWMSPEAILSMSLKRSPPDKTSGFQPGGTLSTDLSGAHLAFWSMELRANKWVLFEKHQNHKNLDQMPGSRLYFPRMHLLPIYWEGGTHTSLSSSLFYMFV